MEGKKMNKLIYLAIPYSWNPEIANEVANKVSANLMKDGHVVFSPISHSHPIANNLDKSLRKDHEFWMKQDLPILAKCDELCLVNIKGIGIDSKKLINESRGVQEEINFAKKENIEIKSIDFVYHKKETEQALRYNENKRKWSMVDFESLEGMVKVLENGALKYNRDNWKKGMPVTEVIESLLRHTFTLLKGEENDKESGLSHISHIQCNAMFIDYILRNKPEFNDLPNNKVTSNKLPKLD